MTTDFIAPRVTVTPCPRCDGDFIPPRCATSRRDGRTRICDPCGTEEAMVDFFAKIGADAPPEWRQRERAFKLKLGVKEGD